MNIFELLFFLLFCVAVGFVGHLVSLRYGWLVGAVVGGSVVALLLVGSYREMLREVRRGLRRRGSRHSD
jgi:hypothetical protein